MDKGRYGGEAIEAAFWFFWGECGDFCGVMGARAGEESADEDDGSSRWEVGDLSPLPFPFPFAFPV